MRNTSGYSVSVAFQAFNRCRSESLSSGLSTRVLLLMTARAPVILVARLEDPGIALSNLVHLHARDKRLRERRALIPMPATHSRMIVFNTRQPSGKACRLLVPEYRAHSRLGTSTTLRPDRRARTPICASTSNPPASTSI